MQNLQKSGATVLASVTAKHSHKDGNVLRTINQIVKWTYCVFEISQC